MYESNRISNVIYDRARLVEGPKPKEHSTPAVEDVAKPARPAPVDKDTSPRKKSGSSVLGARDAKEKVEDAVSEKHVAEDPKSETQTQGDHHFDFTVRLVHQNMDSFTEVKQRAYCGSVAKALGIASSQVSVTGVQAGSVIVSTRVSGLSSEEEVQRVQAAVQDPEGPVQHVLFLGFGTAELYSSCARAPVEEAYATPVLDLAEASPPVAESKDAVGAPTKTNSAVLDAQCSKKDKESVSEEHVAEDPKSQTQIQGDHHFDFTVRLVHQNMDSFTEVKQRAYCGSVAKALGIASSQVSVTGVQAGSVIVSTRVSGLSSEEEVQRVQAAVQDPEGPVQHVLFLGFGTIILVSSLQSLSSTHVATLHPDIHIDAEIDDEEVLTAVVETVPEPVEEDFATAPVEEEPPKLEPAAEQVLEDITYEETGDQDYSTEIFE